MSVVTVIIPTFNRLGSLRKAIQSVQAQSYTDWLLIVVDDGSTDGTGEFLHRYYADDLRVVYLSQTNQGVSAARNLGIASATSPWLAFLDSDDIWLPNKLQSQFDLLETAPSLKWIHGEEIWIRNGVRVNPKKKHKKSGGRQFLRSVDLCCISPSTVMIRQSVFDEVGLFRDDFPVCEDYELWLRISQKYPIGFVETPIIEKYGGHADQLSHKFKAMDYWRIKALVPFLQSEILSAEELLKVAETIFEKSQILLTGYEKHGRNENCEEILSYQEIAKQYLS